MITVDTEREIINVIENGETKAYRFNSPEAFSIISDLWLRVGWDTKYVYSFTWMGRPIIQLPEDMVRIQEVIYALRPDVIIETGVAHGGSLAFYASLCKAIGKGQVVGIDIEIRPHNREAIEAHELFSFITLIEGSSIASDVVERVKSHVREGDMVLVILDSCHSKVHVLSELQAYSALVSPGSYVVVTDGIMGKIVGAPRSNPDWAWNNPRQAAVEFVAENPRFIIEEPAFAFNEGLVRSRVSYWPDAFVKRIV